jgi:ABC-type dipeptide/oligopeptide/nickel transport system permease subunit
MFYLYSGGTSDSGREQGDRVIYASCLSLKLHNLAILLPLLIGFALSLHMLCKLAANAFLTQWRVN